MIGPLCSVEILYGSLIWSLETSNNLTKQLSSPQEDKSYMSYACTRALFLDSVEQTKKISNVFITKQAP